MKGRKRVWLPAILAALAVTAAAPADEFTWRERKIKFETSDEPLRVQLSGLDPRPKYVAVIASAERISFSRRELARLSEAQEALMARYFRQVVTRPYENVLRLYAVSEADARLIAQAVIEMADKRNRRRFDRAVQEVRRLRARIPDAEETVAANEPELKKIDVRLEGLKKAGYFQNPEEAKKIAAELGMLLNQIDIDIAGLKAKIQTLSKRFSKARVTESMRDMHLAIEVDLVGALVRMRAAQEARARALDYMALSERRGVLQKQLDGARRTLTPQYRKHNAKWIEATERELANPPPHMRPVVIKNNTVFIHPVVPPATTRPAVTTPPGAE